MPEKPYYKLVVRHLPVMLTVLMGILCYSNYYQEAQSLICLPILRPASADASPVQAYTKALSCETSSTEVDRGTPLTLSY